MAHIKNYDILFASVAIVLAGTLVYLADFVGHFYGGGRQRNRNNQKGMPSHDYQLNRHYFYPFC